MIKKLSITTHGPGLYEFTSDLQAALADADIDEGLCTVFLRHTSASLVIQENADPAVQRDLQHWLDRLVRRGDPLYTHTTEGPDDMPAHIKTALTASALSIPVVEHRLALGTWQGVYLWEHRDAGSLRQLVVHVGQ